MLTAAIAAGVRKIVCLSTDKAVYPVNPMGISKTLMDLTEAIDLVVFAFENARAGDLMVKKEPACKIGDLARAL